MPATRTNSANESASPESQSKELPERSRNAKAQARHREKRKAYISHLEQSVATLKQQLASMGISGAIPAHALSSSSTPAETDARLRELLEENERLKSEIQRLRSKVESLGGSASASSRSSTGHHGLTPPATPGVLGGLGAAGSVSGALLPSTSDEYDARRGSVLPGSVESFLASAFVPFLTISPPPLPSSQTYLNSPPLLDSPPYIPSPSAGSSPYYNSSSAASPYHPSTTNSPSPMAQLLNPAAFPPYGGSPSSSSASSDSSYLYPSSASRFSLQSFAIM